MAVRRAWWGTAGLFLLHGLLVSTWISRIPAVQTSLQLSNGVLGVALLCTTLGALVAIPVTGGLINRSGSKLVSSTSTAALCGSVVLPGLAWNAVTLSLALFVFGATAAAMDVSMNAQGVEVEKRLGYPTMSRFHGMFSVGGMAGAGLGGLVAAHGVTFLRHAFISSCVYLFATVGVAPLLLPAEERVSLGHARLPLRKVPRVLLALSAIGFCILLSEGAMADWTAVYLKQVTHAGPGTATAGYSVFSATMATFRFLGDWVTARLGPFRTVRTGSIVGACGLMWAIAVHSPLWALPGFAIVGAGFSVIIPLVFGSGGRIENVSPGAGIATVTGLGYVGFIVGPPTIGFLSELVTLRWAIGVVVLCCIGAALMSTALRTLPGPYTQGPCPEEL
ncbi:MAG: MFS transporter [Acidobacteriaceae bacterium]|nr:MFS transporter [Acidobacteriaceae bacterium]